MNILHKYSNLSQLYNKNTIYIQKKIIECIFAQPYKNDCEGYVYGFMNKTDNNNKTDFYIKLGRTSRKDPSIRIKEQDGEQIFSLKTIFNRKLEKLIHLFFNFAHEIRRNKNNTANEIEWFHFVEKINIIGLVNEIKEMVNDIYETCDIDDTDDIDEYHHVELLNINTCSQNEIMKINGFGPKLSSYIILNRPYNDLNELNKIKGIGPKKMEIIKKYFGVFSITNKKLIMNDHF